MARLHKVTAEEVKALRATSDMPMSECAKVLREKAKDSYIEDLEKENAKLRKLVHGLNWCTEGIDGPRVDCEHCPLGVADVSKPLTLMCEVMMRELGIEM